MAQRTLPIFVDVANAQLIRSATNTAPATLPAFYQGDTVTLVMKFLDTTQSPPAVIDYSTAVVTVAVGFLGGQPTAGLFTLTDTTADQTTCALPYNASAIQVQFAVMQALTSNWTNTTMLGRHGGPWTITNGVNGAQTALVGSPVTLNPLSAVAVNRLQAGTSSLPEMQTIALQTIPIALQDTWTANTEAGTLTGNLALDTGGIEQAMGMLSCIHPALSIQVTPASGEAFTVYQHSFTIHNDLIDGAPSIPTPGVAYYTTTQSDDRYLRNNIPDSNFRINSEGYLQIASDTIPTVWYDIWFDGNGNLASAPGGD